MERPRYLKGRRFDRWTVVERDMTARRGKQVYWVCRCDCGTVRSVAAGSLLRGLSRSCRCIVTEVTARRNHKHGGSRSTEHLVWCNMRRRCNDPTTLNYHLYGGRGITVCDRWQDFAAFLADMGSRPSPKHSIDRKDNNRGYSPENCVWQTRAHQNRNTRQNHYLTFQGRTQTITDWARQLGLRHTTLCQRINQYGWSIEKALTTPVTNRI